MVEIDQSLLRTCTITQLFSSINLVTIGDLAFETINYKHGLLIFRQLSFSQHMVKAPSGYFAS